MKIPNTHQRIQSKHLTLVGALIIVAGAMFGPIYAVRSGSLPSVVRPATPTAAKNDKGSSRLASNFKSFLPMPAFPETIETFASNCTTPKTDFDLGETVCAKITGAPLVNGPGGVRPAARIGWVSPYGSFAQGATITTDPQNGTYLIPATQTQTFTDDGGGTTVVDNRGTWSVNTFSSLDGSLRNSAYFTVHDPTTPYVDLYATQAQSEQEAQVNAGSSSVFHIFVSNVGPDAAQNVVLTDNVPANTTFVAMVQASGPTFSCTTPAVGGTGAISCTITSLAKGDAASFDLAYNVNSSTPVGTTITNVTTITSDTGELTANDNTSTAASTVVAASTGGGSGDCSVGCPDDVVTDANTTQSGQDGAVVHFSPPSGNDECGAIVVDHCNDCFFPVGITTVTASSATGDSCSFTVTVNPPNTGNAAIVCPANQTANAGSSCEAVVNVGTPVVSGNNVTFHGVRSDGKPMYNCDCFPLSPDQANDACNVNGACTRKSSDAPFASGVTTITWIAYTHDVPGPYATPEEEEAHRTGSASCTQTITVNDVTAPTISATDSEVSADASCMAAVPDYSNTVDDNCACSSSDSAEDCQGHPHITYTQSPAAGTMVGLGPHTIHITANDNSSNNGGAGNTTTKDVVFTVKDTTAPVITCPSNISNVPTETGTCAAHVTPGTATATDNCDGSPTITGTRSDSRPLTDTYPKGTTTITWTATDDAGNSSSCNQTITVVDNEPPVIVFNGQTPSMWPPNHKYQTFQVTNFVTSVTDNCDSIGVGSVYITKVTSDEIENGNGDGNTMNDIVIAADCKSLQLRSEREGNGDGRIYTIFFKVVDLSGNVGTGTAKVVVRHNPGETPVDSGPHYTVMSSCP